MYILKGSLCLELAQVRLKFLKLYMRANVLYFLISTFFFCNFVFMDVKKLQYIVCQMETQEMHSITQQLSCNR